MLFFKMPSYFLTAPSACSTSMQLPFSARQ